MDKVLNLLFEDNAKKVDKLVRVTKRDGTQQVFDADKINRVVEWACEGLDCSPSEIILKTKLHLFDGVETDALHVTLEKSAADLISKDEPDYSIVAGRLLAYRMRKLVYNQFQPTHLFSHTHKLVEAGKYDKEIIEDYAFHEFVVLNDLIKHEKELSTQYAGIKLFYDKYLIKDRVTSHIFETPQMALMLISMVIFSKYDKDVRLDYVKRFYTVLSENIISLPTPIMAGVRTPTRQFSSCVLIEAGDDLDSIFFAAHAQGRYAASRAGIGLNFGSIRAEGSPIRNGEVKHAGLVGIAQLYQSALGWTSQGGVRKASSTVFYPVWHLDFEKLIVLKNNKGTEETRARHLDYGVQFSRIFYQRLVSGGNITLFSPDVADGELYRLFFADNEAFEKLYVQLENDESVTKKTIPAMELFSTFASERASTGRIYLQNVDHCNTHSSFNVPIKQSNLCLEITLPTEPIMKDYTDPEDGEIALCTLGAFNLMYPEHIEEAADLLVRALDALLDYQGYPVAAAEKALKRRSLGIGVVNGAYYIAKRGMTYSDGSANDAIHEVFEKIQFYCLKASMELAAEQGKCELFHETKYSQGILPIDTYKKDVDKHVSTSLKCDWKWLRGEIAKHGLRNSTLTALMPSETSSQISNATNGIEPVRELVSTKSGGHGAVKQIVPELQELADKYELKFSMKSPVGYLTLVAIMQKFVDQAISANTPYNPDFFEGGVIQTRQVLKDILTAYSLGVKTLYYYEVKDMDTDDCSSCKI